MNAEEQALREELLQLCKSAIIRVDGITECGETPPWSDKPWHIQCHGENIYLTLEEAQDYLENLTK